jgi:hypothetical protein
LAWLNASGASLGGVSTTRRPRTPEELRGISKVLQYEVWMFVSTLRTLAIGVLGPGPMHNAVLESFAVHTRGVIDFLFPPGNARPTDLIADDFFDDVGAWRSQRGEMSTFLTLTRKRVGLLVAHLTEERVGITPEEKSWDFAKILSEIRKHLRTFVEHVPKERIDESLANAVETLG